MSPATSFTLPHILVEYYTLANGLRVVLSEDHSVPVVSVVVYYDVGLCKYRAWRMGVSYLFDIMILHVIN